MLQQTGMSVDGGDTRPQGWRSLLVYLPLLAGALLLAVPTVEKIAGVSWSTEQGAHGPVVLAIAVWLFWRRWPAIRSAARPGSPLLGGAALVVCMLAYICCRIIGSIVLESASLYGILVCALYLFVGVSGMRQAWFPIFYFLFVLPPPGSVVATATQPLRLEITAAAVSLLATLGLPVAQSGVLIYIGQYALEVKAACSGLNSMISLSAIGLFYAYIRHSANLAYMIGLFVVIIGMAIMANFIRVILLVLITYYLGNDAAQGFLHEFAGMTMFVVAVAGTMAVDGLAERIWPDRMSARAPAAV